MEIKIRTIEPVYIMGRYGLHELIPVKDPWEDEIENEIEFIIPESYWRAIGNTIDCPDSIDLDGGPFMSKGTKITDYLTNTVYMIKNFDCHGKYPILICSKLSS